MNAHTRNRIEKFYEPDYQQPRPVLRREEHNPNATCYVLLGMIFGLVLGALLMRVGT